MGPIYPKGHAYFFLSPDGDFRNQCGANWDFSNVEVTGACCTNDRVDALTKVVYAGN